MSLEHENLSVVWHLPQPSTALLRGTSTELVARRCLAIRMELETDEGVETWTLSFQGVRFFSVAYDGARGVDELAAYDRLLDLGETPLLARVRAQLDARGERTALRHLAFNTDDVPAYEVVCERVAVDVSR
ncbi:MAG: hypothetical protein MUE69_16750 [Myxococcota bacterium]|nr:hypothetical protein [Myxococcota bacterium]